VSAEGYEDFFDSVKVECGISGFEIIPKGVDVEISFVYNLVWVRSKFVLFILNHVYRGYIECIFLDRF
jgi:hypothetical protein